MTKAKAGRGHGGKRSNQTGRPPLPEDQKMISGSITLTPPQRAKVKALAQQRGVSMTAIVREAVDALPEAVNTPLEADHHHGA